MNINISRFKTSGILGLACMVLLLGSAANADPVGKTDICHKPGEHNQKTLNIDLDKDGPKHFSHGDYLVTAPMCDAIADNNCDGITDDPADDDADCVSQLGAGATCMAGICEPVTGDTPIGTITTDILRGGTPPGSDRGVESAAGNLVADAQLWATSSNGAQVAFMNPGGVRSDLAYLESDSEGDGVVTYGEAFTFQPFGNTLWTFPMTGAQIVSVLEEQCQPTGSSRPFLHLGVSDGFTYDLATTVVAGDCTSVTVSNVMLNGSVLSSTATYMVTVNNFLANGGDNFTTFATIDPSTRLDGGNDLEAIVNYFGALSPVAPPSTDRVNELP